MRTCPTLDATLFDAEDEHRTTFDHGAALVIVESAGNARDDALSGSVDEAEGIDGGFNVADEGRDVWVAAHDEVEP